MAQPLWMQGTPVDQAAASPAAVSPAAIPTTPSGAPIWTQGQPIDQSAAAPAMAPSVPSPTPATPGFWGPVIDYAKNIGTGFESAAADVGGLPAAFNQWISKYIPPDPGSFQANPNQPPPSWWPKGVPLNPPQAPDIRQSIVAKTGLDYVPSTAGGRIAQRAAEFGGVGLLGGPAAVPFAAAGGAAQQTGQELGAPDWFNTTLGIAAPLLAHTGASFGKLLLRPTTEAGQMAAANQVLGEVATDPNAPINPPLIPGAPQTLGMATDDPGIRAFEKGRFSTAGPMVPEYAKIQQGVSKATTEALNQGVATVPNRAGSVMQMENTAADMHQHMLDAKDAGLTGERAAWNPVDPNNTLSTPIAPLKASLQSAKDALGVVNADLYPNYIDTAINKLEGLGPDAPFNEVKALHTRVLNDLRDAQSPTNPDRNLAHGLMPIEQTLRKTMDNIVSSDPAQQAALDTARQTSANFHTVYDNKKVVQALNGVPSKAGNILSTPEGVDAYYAATGGSPAAMDAARKYFMAGLARDAINQDGSLSAAAFNNNLRDNQSLLSDRRFFTQDQADTLNQAGQQLNSLQQTPRMGMGGQSPTYQLLTTGEQAKALVGQTGQTALKALSGARTAMGGLAGLALGDTTTGMLGALLARALPEVPYKQAGEKVLEYVDQALADPAFAAKLRTLPPQSSLISTQNPALKAATLPILLGGGAR